MSGLTQTLVQSTMSATESHMTQLFQTQIQDSISTQLQGIKTELNEHLTITSGHIENRLKEMLGTQLQTSKMESQNQRMKAQRPNSKGGSQRNILTGISDELEIISHKRLNIKPETPEIVPLNLHSHNEIPVPAFTRAFIVPGIYTTTTSQNSVPNNSKFLKQEFIGPSVEANTGNPQSTYIDLTEHQPQISSPPTHRTTQRRPLFDMEPLNATGTGIKVETRSHGQESQHLHTNLDEILVEHVDRLPSMSYCSNPKLTQQQRAFHEAFYHWLQRIHKGCIICNVLKLTDLDSEEFQVIRMDFGICRRHRQYPLCREMTFYNFMQWKGDQRGGTGFAFLSGSGCFKCGLPWIFCNQGKDAGPRDCPIKDAVYPLLWLVSSLPQLRKRVAEVLKSEELGQQEISITQIKQIISQPVLVNGLPTFYGWAMVQALMKVFNT